MREDKYMKRILRLLLFIATLAVGGWLGAVLLTDFEPLKILAFSAICGVLGEVVYRIDKRISQE